MIRVSVNGVPGVSADYVDLEWYDNEGVLQKLRIVQDQTPPAEVRVLHTPGAEETECLLSTGVEQ